MEVLLVDAGRGLGDEIAHGDETRSLADGLRGRWRRPLALAVAMCVGLANLAGFDVVWGGLDEPRTVRPRDTADIAYELTVDCDRGSPEVAAARLHVGAGPSRLIRSSWG